MYNNFHRTNAKQKTCWFKRHEYFPSFQHFVTHKCCINLFLSDGNFAASSTMIIASIFYACQFDKQKYCHFPLYYFAKLTHLFYGHQCFYIFFVNCLFRSLAHFKHWNIYLFLIFLALCILGALILYMLEIFSPVKHVFLNCFLMEIQMFPFFFFGRQNNIFIHIMCLQ